MTSPAVCVRLGSFLRRRVAPEHLNSNQELQLPGFRGSVRSLLRELGRQHPKLGEEILDETGEPESHLLVAVNKRLVVGVAGLDEVVGRGDLVEVHLLIAGG